MRGIWRAVLILTVMAIALIILIFVLENQQMISLSFMGWTTSQWSVSVFVGSAFIIGMLIGPFVRAIFSLGLRRKKVVDGER